METWGRSTTSWKRPAPGDSSITPDARSRYSSTSTLLTAHRCRYHSRWQPEREASLSGCHLLWYLHLCAVNKVEVLEYLDRASGVMLESPGAGRFQEVVLRPQVSISASSDEAVALQLHEQAHRECFIANSVNFPVRHEPVITRAQPEAPST